MTEYQSQRRLASAGLRGGWCGKTLYDRRNGKINELIFVLTEQLDSADKLERDIYIYKAME